MTQGESTPEPITVFHLELCRCDDFRPSAYPAGFHVEMLDPPEPHRNRELYRAVGEKWQWTDKLTWLEKDWRNYVCRDALKTYLAFLDGSPVGYFELETQEDGNVQITYLGLLPENIGKGLGGALLTASVEQAWQLPNTVRVWVHTCTLDHKHALANYQKRGFTVFLETSS